MLAANGCKSVDIVAPGFSSDCLETLEELSSEAKTFFSEKTVRWNSYVKISLTAGLVAWSISWLVDGFGNAGGKALLWFSPDVFKHLVI